MKSTVLRSSLLGLSIILPAACLNKATKSGEPAEMDAKTKAEFEAAYAEAAAKGGISGDDAYAKLGEGAASGEVKGGQVILRVPTAVDQKAIQACSKAFGQPLPVGAEGKVRLIAANVSLLGGSTLADNRMTEQPELTIVMASVNVLGSMRWQLMNPNGMYCIVTNVNILSRLTVEIANQAQLADGTLGVNILSPGSSGPGSIGVNILSRVKVIRK